MNQMNQNNTRKMTRSFAIGVAALLALFTHLAQADGREAGFEMKAVADREHGDRVLTGNYPQAIARNRTWAKAIAGNTDPERVFPFAVSTNLCVAYTMTARLQDAQAPCDAAVQAAEVGASRGQRRNHDYLTEWATALSNRGVLRALSGDATGARADFARAMTLGSASSLPETNLARLDASFEAIALQ